MLSFHSKKRENLFWSKYCPCCYLEIINQPHFPSSLNLNVLLCYFSSKIDLTDNLLYHCGWCLRNISHAACMMLGNGSLSCVTCREHKIAHEVDLLCGYCPTRNDRTVTDLPIQNSCETCVCNGTTSKKRLKRCISMDQGRCFSCQSNRTGVYCELCGRGKLHVCQIESEGDKVEPQRSTG